MIFLILLFVVIIILASNVRICATGECICY